MGVFTVLVFGFILAILTGLYEGGKALLCRIVEALSWHKERAVHYPKRMSWQ